MRIRIFQAFASNNSGSYTIVGSFSSPQVATEIAAMLRAVSAEHDAWFEQHAYEQDGESPLDVFVREQGLTDERPGRSDDWPEHGRPASIAALGSQVLVHAPYTVTMPRLFGEFFYKRGGRVDVELDHSHEELAVEISFCSSSTRWDDPDTKRQLADMERALAPVLPPLVARSAGDERAPVAPVFHDGFGGSRQLTAVFNELVAGVEAVRVVAEQHGISLRIRVIECPQGVVDPLAHLRASIRPWGRTTVILWSIGSDRVSAMKALREVLGSELTEAKAAIDGLPKEVLVEVDQAYAERAVDVLREAGCEAEAVVPARRS